MKSRVLIVDDDPTIVDALGSLLELEDIENAGACDRLSARAMFTGTFYPVIVADVRLETDEQGLELLEDIRRESPQSRVISLTGFSTPELERELRLRGSTSTISKPSSDAEIIGTIKALLAEVERLVDARDTADLEQLHHDVRKVLHSIAIRKFRLGPDEAEDVVQQAWLLFLERRGVVRSPPAWLAGTVSNLCRKTINTSRRSRETFVNVAAIDSIADPSCDAQHRAFDLDQAMATLDLVSRTVCRLIAVEGRQYGEVSAMTGLPLGSIGPMYIRAKKKMLGKSGPRPLTVEARA
jgi:RNA polymerase sigma factor (sigma-70 family)